MQYQVNVEHEEEPAKQARVYAVTTPEQVSLKAKYRLQSLERLEADVKKLVKDGLEWQHLVEEDVYQRLKIRLPRLIPFSTQMIAAIPEVVEAISKAVIQDQGWDQIKREQLKLEETVGA